MQVRKTHRTKTMSCLNCGQRLDACSAVGADAAPSPGDATVCFYCGHLMVFDVDLSLRHPTDKELHDMAGDPRLVAINNLRPIKIPRETP